ncbi:MAG: hypothetical protein ACOCYB_07510 [Alkalispirochaeta sp.]
MSRLLARAYLLFSILALVLIAVFFFWRLGSVISAEEERATTRFSTLSHEVTQSWRSNSVEDAGRETSQRLVQGDSAQSPLVVSVYSFDEGVDYLWAQDGQLLEYMPSAHSSTPQIRANDFVHRRFTRSFELPDGSRRIVTAVYSVLPRQSAYSVLRDTLVAFLGLIAAGLMIALIHTVTQAARMRRVRRDIPPAASPLRTTPPSPLPSDDSVPMDEPPSLGLMPHEGLQHRLSLELERAGFHEQDLTVAWFAFQNVSEGPSAYHNAQAILAFFRFADLCFDAGQDAHTQSVVVLLPNTPLSEALAQVERFQAFYWEERHTWGRQDADFACGLTARNGRLVDAERVIQECRAAVRRAHTLPGRIVGFQPDPQRYRDYISGHSS